MSPEVLLALLVQTRAQLPDALGTPFLLQTPNQRQWVLAHPTFPGSGLLLDAAMQDALQRLIQWGYLAQPVPS